MSTPVAPFFELDLHPLREDCRTPNCPSEMGRITRVGFQDTVWCIGCSKFQYNAPRSETGAAKETVRSRPEIKPSQRARILTRDGNRCVYCGGSPADGRALHIGHLISVHDAEALGLTDDETYSDENLAAMCAECNLGIGRDSVPARFIAALVRHRARGVSDTAA